MSDLLPPTDPHHGNRARRPTPEAVERICQRIATERGLTLNNVMFGYGAVNKSARRDAFKAVVAETGCSVSGLAQTLGRDRSGLFATLAYVDQPAKPARPPRAPRSPRTLPSGSEGVSVCQDVRDEVLAEVHRETGVPPSLILSRDKSRAIYRARAEALWRLRDMKRADGSPKYSFSVLGRTFGIHHTAAMDAVGERAGRVRA